MAFLRHWPTIGDPYQSDGTSDLVNLVFEELSSLKILYQ